MFVKWLSAFMMVMSLVDGQPATPPVTVPAFTAVSWMPAAVQVLQKNSVSIAGIKLGESGDHLGDTVTVLAQASEQGRVRQWAVVLSSSDIKPEEKKLRTAPLTLYVTSGGKVEFASGPLGGMLIHVFGPFSSKDGSKHSNDIWSGSLVNPQYLALGLDGTVAFWLRITDVLAEEEKHHSFVGFNFSTGNNPAIASPPAELKGLFDRLKISPAEERSYAGMVVALSDFFRVANQTPGVRDILFEAVDVPWMSLMRHGGRIDDVNFDLCGPFERLNPVDWGMPNETNVYGLGIRLLLFGKPALHCHFAVTAPRVPLLNSAGILGISAQRPDGKGPLVTIRVMAGQPAPSLTHFSP